jgi:hypothetical protein
MEGRNFQEDYRSFRGGRYMRGRGGCGYEDKQQQNQRQMNRNWDERRGGHHGGRNTNHQWRQRDQEDP